MDPFFRLRDLPERELVPGVRYREIGEGDEMLLFVTLEPGSRVPRHFHRHEQVSYVASGRVEFEVEGVKRILGAGEGVHIPPGTTHGERALLPSVVVHGWSRHLAEEARRPAAAASPAH